MPSVIVVTVMFGGFALAGAKVLFRRVRYYLRWRKDASMVSWKRGLLILFPLVLTLTVFGRPLLVAPGEYPVQRSQLREITAPVEMVWEYQSHRATGRSIQTVKEYRIYLEGYDGYLYVPDNFSFDRDAFLRWAGPEKITFLYARTAERLTVYQIQQAGRVFLDYSQAWERLMTTFLSDFLMWLTLLLFGLGGSVYLPEYLSPCDRAKRNRRILGLVFAALALVAFVVLNHLASRPEITKTYAAVIGVGENLVCAR